jgi:RNA-directed DNA polymerase
MENAVRKFYVEELYQKLGFNSSVPKSDRLRQVSIIRYADDFVIIHESYEVVLACKNFVSEWLKDNAGLCLSEAKTNIVKSGNGFEFLGFQFISITEKETRKTKCRASVSAKSKKRLISKVHSVLQKHRSSTQETLIKTLNPIIVGWCNYYCVHECSKDFKQVEGTIFKMLEAWAKRRAANGMGVEAVMKKYFNTEEKHEVTNQNGSLERCPKLDLEQTNSSF